MLGAISGFLKHVLGGHQGGGRPRLTNTTKSAPLTGRWFRRHSRTLNLRSGHPTIFVIICLRYGGLDWPDGPPMTIEGPKNDLLLFLRHVQYRHQDEDRQFLIFTDFDVDFEDHTGFTGAISRIPATRDNIVDRIQGTMRDMERGEKCLLYYSGHIQRDPQQTKQAGAHILLPNNERIYDHELRGWLRLSRFPTATIIVVFDACYSGGFLALPYAHEKDDARMKRVDTPSAAQMKSQVIEISATTKFRLSFSGLCGENEEDPGTVHGILTWNLLQYLKVNPRPKLHRLVSHIYSTCDTWSVDEHGHTSRQVPLLSSSRRISGTVSIF